MKSKLDKEWTRMQEIGESVETNCKEISRFVKRNKFKYILSVFIFVFGFLFYMGFMVLWQDNHTTYILHDCTKNQKEIIQKEINVDFPDSTEIDEIVYYWTWGNDIPRTFSIELQMNMEDYKNFVLEDTNYISIKDVLQDDKICKIYMFYTSDTYTPLAGWMEDNGQENIGYKRSVSVAVFFFLVIASLMPLIPYKKILSRSILCI